MLIKKIILKNYRRFALNNIELLEYTPESIVQIILGDNGVGKSSLVRELTPLPADLKKDYKEDGYKYIEIEHNHRTYVISSGYVTKGKHSFICDDVEMNQAGIRKIQLGLVEEHFNITPQVHEILLGNMLFTGMNVSDRKKWLSKISNIDYTYSISVFNKLKQKHRDIVGAIKITQNKQLQEDNKLMNDNDRLKLERDLEALKSMLSYLLDNKTVSTTVSNRKSDIEYEQDIKYTKQLLRNLDKYDMFKSVDVENKITVCNATISNNSKRIETLNKNIKELKELTDGKDVDADKESLLKEQSILTQQLKDIEKYNKYKVDLNDIDTIYSNYKYLYSDFISILNSISDYGDITYSTKKVEELNSKTETVINNIKLVERKIDKLETEDKHYEKHHNDNQVQCDKCGNSWHLHYDSNRHALVKKELAQYRTKYEELKIELEKLQKLNKEYNNKANEIKRLRMLISNNKSLLELFKVIIGDNNIQTDIGNIITNANEVNVLFEKMMDYSKVLSKLNEVKDKLKIVGSEEAIKIKHGLEIIGKYEKELSECIEDKYRAELAYKEYSNYLKSVKGVEEMFSKLKSNVKHMNTNLHKNVAELKNSKINEMVNYIKFEISQIEKQLHDSYLMIDRIKQTTIEVEKLKAKEIVLKLMVKELSPTEGLIAKSINSFLNVFITEINNIINSIWSYDMVLLPCIVSDDNDLDYKFPVKINNSETIADVSLGSSSMKEIIDLAFKIVFMKYLGIISAPLILDEFGKTMDPVHRINAYDTIDNTLSTIFNQIFIISHFESMYGRFKNADVCILSTDNLLLDKDLQYNKVMKIN